MGISSQRSTHALLKVLTPTHKQLETDGDLLRADYRFRSPNLVRLVVPVTVSNAKSTTESSGIEYRVTHFRENYGV